jgi:hypothetical protein
VSDPPFYRREGFPFSDLIDVPFVSNEHRTDFRVIVLDVVALNENPLPLFAI